MVSATNNLAAPIDAEAVSEALSGVFAFDIEGLFRAHFAQIARVIARVIRDHARAEELAVEAFLKLQKHTEAHTENARGWLYRTAVRSALDELRRRRRRERYEKSCSLFTSVQTPEDALARNQEQERVRVVLGSLASSKAELLVLRSNDLSYAEMAKALNVNPASVGKSLSRAQQAFRNEYVRRYGKE